MAFCTCGNHRERMGEHQDTCPAYPKNRPGRLRRLWNSRPDNGAYLTAALVIVILLVAALRVGIAVWIVREVFGF